MQNVVVAGGGALLPGLCARLGEEIRALALGADDSGNQAAASRLEISERYAWGRAVVSGQAGAEGERKGLCVSKVPVRRDALLWTGASIMACLAGLGDRSLTSEQYLAREGGRLPDWLSVSPSDWLFEAAPAAAV